MSLKDRINTELTAAMKAGEKLRTETLRSLRALVIEFEKSGAAREMTPDDEMKLLLSAAKKRKDSIEVYATNNRPELAAKEQAELEIINEYLPKQMSRDEIAARVAEVIASVGAAGPADTNKVIPVLMKEMKGKADRIFSMARVSSWGSRDNRFVRCTDHFSYYRFCDRNIRRQRLARRIVLSSDRRVFSGSDMLDGVRFVHP